MHAALVGSGILLSRLLGIARESLKARYLGATGSVAADAFHAAFRIPNILQNLFGEGALSASFIPAYSKALSAGTPEDADRLAGAVAALLALVTAVLVLLGVLFAPALVAVIATGFTGEKRELTIVLTRILFPGAAVFVLSAWCLGVLNSHRRFFLSYAAPVMWNLAMIAALLVYRRSAPAALAVNIAWASVIGAALTFLVQLPVVLRVAPALRLSLGRGNASVRGVVRNFVPAFFSRGVVQVNAYVDQLIASFLPTGAVSLLFYTQTLTMLPISLFGMSVSAAELPAMASVVGTDAETAAHVRTRMQQGLRHLAFLVIPSAVAFLMLGDVLAAALFEYDRFSARDTLLTWGILAAASLGLLASTMARLYASAFFALQDTRTPLRIAIVRVLVATGLGALLAFRLPDALGVSADWGAASLALSSSIAGWTEFTLLRRRLNARVGATGAPVPFAFALLAAALVAGAASYAVKLQVAGLHQVLVAVVVLGIYGTTYFLITRVAGIPESRAMFERLRRLLRR